MNLTNILREGEITDLNWMKDGSTFNPSNMGLDMEEQLEIQGDKKVEPQTKEALVKRRVRELMNKGEFGKKVIDSSKKAYCGEVLPKSLKKFIASREGILGTVLVDCSVIGNKPEYNKIAASAPFGSFNQYAINCTCDHKRHSADDEGVEVAENGSIDAILNSGRVKAAPVDYCQKTGLPVLVNHDLYTASDANKVLAKLVKLDYITDDTKKQLMSVNPPLMAVKKAFLNIYNAKQKEADEKYSGDVDVSAFAIKSAGMVASVEDVPKKNLNIKDIREAAVGDFCVYTKQTGDIDYKTIERKETGMRVEVAKLAGIEAKEATINQHHKQLDIDNYDNVIEEIDVDRQIAPVEIECEEPFAGDIDVDMEENIDKEWFVKPEIKVVVNKDDFVPFDIDNKSEFNF